jgi:hypothetical protein
MGPVLNAQEDPEWTAEKELCMRRGIPYVAPRQKENIEDEEYMSAEASSLSVGARCEVDPGGKRGVIRCSNALAAFCTIPCSEAGRCMCDVLSRLATPSCLCETAFALVP